MIRPILIFVYIAQTYFFGIIDKYLLTQTNLNVKNVESLDDCTLVIWLKGIEPDMTSLSSAISCCSSKIGALQGDFRQNYLSDYINLLMRIIK